MSNVIEKFEFEKAVAFEEGGIESYDYRSIYSGNTLVSERACYIESLNVIQPNPFYENMTLHQLEAEAIRKGVYVDIKDM